MNGLSAKRVGLQDGSSGRFRVGVWRLGKLLSEQCLSIWCSRASDAGLATTPRALQHPGDSSVVSDVLTQLHLVKEACRSYLKPLIRLVSDSRILLLSRNPMIIKVQMDPAVDPTEPKMVTIDYTATMVKKTACLKSGAGNLSRTSEAD